MDETVMRRKVAEARVARVGTLDQRGSVHLVPVVYVVDGDTWYSPSDPGARPVKRLRNVLADPRPSSSSTTTTRSGRTCGGCGCAGGVA